MFEFEQEKIRLFIQFMHKILELFTEDKYEV